MSEIDRLDTGQVPPPANWPVERSQTLNRWSIEIPAETMDARQADLYEQQSGDLPPADWKGTAFTTYVRVTWPNAKGRQRWTVLKVKMLPGNAKPTVAIAASVFANDTVAQATQVTLTGSSLREFRFARLRISSGVLRVAALLAGIASGLITLAFAIGKMVGPVVSVSPATEILLLLGAAVFTIASAVASFFAVEWFKPDLA